MAVRGLQSAAGRGASRAAGSGAAPDSRSSLRLHGMPRRGSWKGSAPTSRLGSLPPAIPAVFPRPRRALRHRISPAGGEAARWHDSRRRPRVRRTTPSLASQSQPRGRSMNWWNRYRRHRGENPKWRTGLRWEVSPAGQGYWTPVSQDRMSDTQSLKASRKTECRTRLPLLMRGGLFLPYEFTSSRLSIIAKSMFGLLRTRLVPRLRKAIIKKLDGRAIIKTYYRKTCQFLRADKDVLSNSR